MDVNYILIVYLIERYIQSFNDSFTPKAIILEFVTLITFFSIKQLQPSTNKWYT